MTAPKPECVGQTRVPQQLHMYLGIINATFPLLIGQGLQASEWANKAAAGELSELSRYPPATLGNYFGRAYEFISQ